MEENESISSLKEKLHQYNVEAKKRGILTNFQRKVRQHEDELLTSGLKLEFEINISELVSNDLGNSKIGPHGHSLNLYTLSWKKSPKDGFRLRVRNTLANKTKNLFDCPDYIQKICLDEIESFYAKIKNQLN